MSWKCDCGEKLKGKEIYCPHCAARIVYRCKKCGKELDDGKRKYCPVCNTEKAENRKKAVKNIGGAAAGVVAGAGYLVAAIITKGKNADKN